MRPLAVRTHLPALRGRALPQGGAPSAGPPNPLFIVKPEAGSRSPRRPSATPQPMSPGKTIQKVTMRVKPSLRVIIDNPAGAPPCPVALPRRAVKFGKSRKISPPQPAKLGRGTPKGTPRKAVNTLAAFRRSCSAFSSGSSKAANTSLLKAMARCFIAAENTPTVVPYLGSPCFPVEPQPQPANALAVKATPPVLVSPPTYVSSPHRASN